MGMWNKTFYITNRSTLSLVINYNFWGNSEIGKSLPTFSYLLPFNYFFVRSIEKVRISCIETDLSFICKFIAFIFANTREKPVISTLRRSAGIWVRRMCCVGSTALPPSLVGRGRVGRHYHATGSRNCHLCVLWNNRCLFPGFCVFVVIVSYKTLKSPCLTRKRFVKLRNITFYHTRWSPPFDMAFFVKCGYLEITHVFAWDRYFATCFYNSMSLFLGGKWTHQLESARSR